MTQHSISSGVDRPRFVRLAQRLAVLCVLVLPLVLPTSSALAAPHCNPLQDSSACDPASVDPNPSAPPAAPINPVPIVQPPLTISGPQQLISNGGFETGLVAPSALVSTSATPWSLTSLAAEAVTNNPADANNTMIPVAHHCGAHSLHLTDAQGWPSATEQIGVPIFANTLSLDLWVLFPQTSLSAASIHGETDYLNVLLQTVPYDASFGGNYSAGADRIVAINSTIVGRGRWTHIGPPTLNGARYQGRTFSFQLTAATASSGSGFDPSWGPRGASGYGFFVDDISLQAVGAGAAASLTPTC